MKARIVKDLPCPDNWTYQDLKNFTVLNPNVPIIIRKGKPFFRLVEIEYDPEVFE